MKSCYDLSHCTDHPKFSKKVVKNLVISKPASPVAAGVHKAPCSGEFWLNGAALGLSTGAQEEHEELLRVPLPPSRPQSPSSEGSRRYKILEGFSASRWTRW